MDLAQIGVNRPEDQLLLGTVQPDLILQSGALAGKAHNDPS